MKKEMTSADVSALVYELSSGSHSLIDAKIGKIYQPADDEVRINLFIFGKGRDNLVIQAGKRAHLSKHIRPSPKIPKGFPMLLRKHVLGGRITSIRQYDFDRIIEIGIIRGGIETILLCELFSKGNIVLLDENRQIILPMNPVSFKGRKIRSGQIYEYPRIQLDPLSVNEADMLSLFKGSTSDIVRTIATNYNLGGVLAEEVCLRSEMDKSIAAKDVRETDVARVCDSIRKLFSPLSEGELKPCVVLDRKASLKEVSPDMVALGSPSDVSDDVSDDVSADVSADASATASVDELADMIDVVPFDLEQYRDNEKRCYGSFNEALDEFFGKRAAEEVVAEVESVKKEKVNVFERRLNKQRETVAKFEKDIEKFTLTAEKIYEHYQNIEEILNVLDDARSKGYSWKDIRLILKKAKDDFPLARSISNIDPARGIVFIDLDGVAAGIDLRRTIPQNAQVYYEKAKKITKKRDGALVAIEDTIALIQKKEKKVASRRKVVRKKHWYDRFRWFISSDGFLVVGGRDADTNEELVKKYMEKRDIVFHTQSPGAPMTIIKTEGKEVPQSTLYEVAVFEVSYSSVWKSGHFSGDCYWIRPEQVSKTPESGEYLRKGSFVIRGERNYYTDVPVGIAVGLELDQNTRVIGGPLSAIKEHARHIVELVPGKFNQNDIAKKVYRIYVDEIKDPSFVKQVASPDRIAMMLPPGESDIKV